MFNFEWADNDVQNEEAMLKELQSNIGIALDNQNDRFEDGVDDIEYDHITIIVNKVAHRFVLGGPQTSGLACFMENIAEENGYDLDEKGWEL